MEFLFENPFILVILIGIISSFFKKSKNEPKPNTKQPKSFVESIPKRIQDVLEEFEKSQADPARTLQTDYLEAKKQAEAKINQLQEQQKKYMEKVEELETEKQRKRHVAAHVENEIGTNNSFTLDKEKLVDAIIWSEILGPPRSKKPHRSMNVR